MMLHYDFYPGEILVINNGTRVTVAWVKGDLVGLEIESSERIELLDKPPALPGNNVLMFPRLK